MLFNFQEKIRNFFFTSYIHILNIFVIENIQSFFQELCTHFSILRINYSNFELIIEFLHSTLQSSKISWIHIYYFSQDLMDPEGFKNFNIEKGED